MDIRVTGGHRLVYRTRFGRKHFLRTEWVIEEAQKLAQRTYEYDLPIAGVQEAPGVSLTDDELRFIGWFLTDGTLNTATQAINMDQAAHQPHNAAVVACLQGCGFKYSVYKRKPQTHYQATSNQIISTISKGQPRGRDKHLTGWGKLEPYLDKNLSPLLENVTPAQLAVLLETVHLGDGQKANGQSGEQRSYHIATGNKVFAERLQSLCVRRGYKCNLIKRTSNQEPLYVLHIKSTDFRMVGGNTATDRPYLERCESTPGETVWCVTNELSTLVIRRNGKVAVVGNCIGRGTRLAPGKEDCLVLDIADNAGRHSLTVQNLLRLTGGEYGRALPADGATRQGQRGVSLREVQYKAAGQVVEREIRLLPKWEQPANAPGRFKLTLPGKAEVWLAPHGEGKYIVGIVWPGGRKQQQTQIPLPLDWAMGVADEKARKIQSGAAKLVDKAAAWRKAPASPAQLATLDRWSIPYRPGITKGEASDLMEANKARRVRKFQLP